MPKSLQIQLLGSFQLLFDGNPVKGLDSPRLQSFLSYLVINLDSPQSRQQMAFLFWPDSNESQARTNLRNMLFKLREAFPEVDELPGDQPANPVVETRSTTQQLDLDLFQGAIEQTDKTGSGKDQKKHRRP